MPIYEYYCLDCEKTFNAFHSMDAKWEGACGICESESGNIEKVVSAIGNKVDEGKFKAKTGDVVKSHIEETRSEIKKEKRRLKEKVYKND